LLNRLLQLTLSEGLRELERRLERKTAAGTAGIIELESDLLCYLCLSTMSRDSIVPPLIPQHISAAPPHFTFTCGGFRMQTDLTVNGNERSCPSVTLQLFRRGLEGRTLKSSSQGNGEFERQIEQRQHLKSLVGTAAPTTLVMPSFCCTN
jgi:hypothetical protein